MLTIAVFRSRGSIFGTSSQRLSPAAYLVIGGIAVLLAVVVATPRGRELRGRDLAGLRRRRAREPENPSPGGMWSRAERALSQGSVAVAVVVGMLLAVPGPFDLLALGHLARGGYRTVVAAAAIVAFALIKFVVIEIPIVSYAVDPTGTSARVGRFADWMKANELGVIAAVIGVIGAVLIARGYRVWGERWAADRLALGLIAVGSVASLVSECDPAVRVASATASAPLR